MKIISYTQPDGSCAILHPNYNRREKIDDGKGGLRDETDGEVLQRVMENDLPADAQFPTIITEADLPYSGWHESTKTRCPSIRAAWRNPADITSPPVVDMTAAKTLKMATWKGRQRETLFQQLDAAYQRADEQGDATLKGKVATVKQQLRDFPTACQAELDAITTPEALDGYNPVINIVANMDPDVVALI